MDEHHHRSERGGRGAAVMARARPSARPPARPSARPSAHRGGHNPALDGLRALAVLSVLVFHLDGLRGGYLGVDVFFVLSGYLITGQLLAERDRTGRVSLTRFYARRAFRLLPAFWLLAAVGFTVVVLLGTGSADERDEFLRGLVASLLYLNNYWQVVRQNMGAGWLGHTWSLSLEEQFYLLWPLALVALCRWGRVARRLPSLLLTAVVVIMLWRDVLGAFGASATRTYFALDTRADSLLVGCALTAWLRAARPGPAGVTPAVLAARRRLGRVAAVLPVAGPVAVALLAVAMTTAPASGWGPRPVSLSYGGYTVVALLAGLVILAAEVGPATGGLYRALATRPLAWLGRVSYGFYLWHFPVVVYWGDDLTRALGRWPAILAVGAISTALAAGSFYLLERPVQRRRPRWADTPKATPNAAPTPAGPPLVPTGAAPAAAHVPPGRGDPGEQRAAS